MATDLVEQFGRQDLKLVACLARAVQYSFLRNADLLSDAHRPVRAVGPKTRGLCDSDHDEAIHMPELRANFKALAETVITARDHLRM